MLRLICKEDGSAKSRAAFASAVYEAGGRRFRRRYPSELSDDFGWVAACDTMVGDILCNDCSGSYHHIVSNRDAGHLPDAEAMP